MGLSDRLGNLTKRAKDSAADHKSQVEQALQKAAAAADQQTGGKYHDKIVKAEAKAEGYVESLPASGPGSPEAPANTGPQTP